MEKIRIACCGGWHSHAKDFPMDRAGVHCADLPHVFTAVWDDDPIRGQAWAREMGCRFEPDYNAVCADREIDAVIITAGTVRHEELAVQAARAGKHIFIEKALAVEPAEARRIRDAVKQAGIHFTISDPVQKPALAYAKQLMAEGVFGDVTEVRYRACHGFGITDPALMRRFYDKKEAGAGAMFDMGHHAVHVLLWFLGRPERAMGVFSRYSAAGKANDVDDVSAALFLFPSGAIGVAETGWLFPGEQNSFELCGTRGILRWDCDGLRYRLSQKKEWTAVPDSALPPPAVYPLRYWMESILKDTPNLQYGVDEAVEVTEMIAAAYRTDGKGECIEYK